MSTFKNKNSLRTIEDQIVQKLKNNEAWPKFTGSYKKKSVYVLDEYPRQVDVGVPTRPHLLGWVARLLGNFSGTGFPAIQAKSCIQHRLYFYQQKFSV